MYCRLSIRQWIIYSSVASHPASKFYNIRDYGYFEGHKCLGKGWVCYDTIIERNSISNYVVVASVPHSRYCIFLWRYCIWHWQFARGAPTYWDCNSRASRLVTPPPLQPRFWNYYHLTSIYTSNFKKWPSRICTIAFLAARTAKLHTTRRDCIAHMHAANILVWPPPSVTVLPKLDHPLFVRIIALTTQLPKRPALWTRVLHRSRVFAVRGKFLVASPSWTLPYVSWNMWGVPAWLWVHVVWGRILPGGFSGWCGHVRWVCVWWEVEALLGRVAFCSESIWRVGDRVGRVVWRAVVGV